MDHIQAPEHGPTYRFRDTLLVQADLAPAVLLDLSSGHYFETNDSAHELVVALQSGATRADLASCLVSAFAITADQATADVDAILDEWRQRGWIEVID